MCPLHWQQMLIWVYSLFNIWSVFKLVLQIEIIPLWLQILIFIPYITIATLVAIYNFRATVQNTEDPVIQKQKDLDDAGERFICFQGGKNNADLHMWCKLCDCYVNETTKHCG